MAKWTIETLIEIINGKRAMRTDIADRPDRELGRVTIAGQSVGITAAPVVGSKTVSNTAAEIFAGSSRLEGRYAMSVYNEGSREVYWGASGVTLQTGFPILPGDSITWTFSSDEETPIFLIADTQVPVRVVELK